MTIQIKHQEMVTELAKSGATILETLTPEKAHLLHMAVGMAGEAAELLEGVGEHNMAFYEAGPGGEREQAAFQNLIEELGDGEFYIEGFRQGLGVSRDAVLAVEVPNYDKYHGDEPIGVSIISGNILDLVKKHVIYNKPIDVAAITAQLSELEHTLKGFREAYQIDRELVLVSNYDKLKGGKNARYKDGYSDKAAQDRADKVAA